MFFKKITCQVTVDCDPAHRSILGFQESKSTGSHRKAFLKVSLLFTYLSSLYRLYLIYSHVLCHIVFFKFIFLLFVYCFTFNPDCADQVFCLFYFIGSLKHYVTLL